MLSRAWQPTCGTRAAAYLCPFGRLSPHNNLGFCRDKRSYQGLSTAWPGLHPQKGAAAKDKEGQELPFLSFLFFCNQSYPAAFRVIMPGALLKAIFPMERVWVWLYSLWHRREASEWDGIPRDCLWALAFHGAEQDNIHMRQLGHPSVHAYLMAVTERDRE